MTLFDIIVLVVVALAILHGLWKGLVRQIVGLAGVAVGYVVAMHFYGPFTARFLKGFSPAVGHTIAFLGILIACMIAASIIGWLLGKLIGVTGSGALNKIGGALLGAVKGCFIVSVVTMMIIVFLPPENRLLKGSRTITYIEPLAGLLSALAPKSVKGTYDKKASKIRSASSKEKKR
ncbi:MAG TPA: hypothetical protein DCR97_08605 [Deltaproteobacteria bacterium]|nr:hypothetical protein [Deltaproteobacteria bacterium]